MPGLFTPLDWAILGVYVLLCAAAGLLSTRRQRDAEDYFLAGHRVPIWLVAVSVLSTTQSAATFLGAPDFSYGADYTYLASYAGPIVAAWLLSRLLIPRFYALGVTTAYELLRHRYDVRAMRAAAGMYLVGRVLASGARLYLAAIAVSMIVYGRVDADSVLVASFLLVLLGIAFTFLGGLRSIVWSDLVQVVLYVGAAIILLVLLWTSLHAPAGRIFAALAHAPDGSDKLRLLDFSTSLRAPFSLLATFTGIVLLFFASMGLDQDTTQRLLACRDAGEGRRALYASVLAQVPVVLLFMAIGSLLYIFYQRPDLAGGSASSQVSGAYAGERITVFMHYILTEVPPGIRGLVVVGILAAAAVNSGLISMSSVLVQDFYRPWRERRGADLPERHYVLAGRLGMVLLGGALLAMAVLCYHWQHYTRAPLLTFALAVMSFAYSGLLGVYFTALFTSRGSSASVIAALAAGFAAILVQQDYIVDALRLPAAWKSLAFPFQLCLGTAVAFVTCAAVPARQTASA